MQIIKTSREFTSVEKYLMTINPAITSMKDVPDGESIDVNGYLVFVDEKEDGEKSEILSIITPDKKVYSCQSATFKRSIYDIETIMDGSPFSIVKMSGKTKAGRDYINCTLDVSKV